MSSYGYDYGSSNIYGCLPKPMLKIMKNANEAQNRKVEQMKKREETLLTKDKEDLKNYEQQVQQDAKDAAPKFSAQG